MPFSKQSLCSRFKNGGCRKGDSCDFAHGREEQKEARRMKSEENRREWQQQPKVLAPAPSQEDMAVMTQMAILEDEESADVPCEESTMGSATCSICNASAIPLPPGLDVQGCYCFDCGAKTVR